MSQDAPAGTAKPPPVSVVIVNWNLAADTLECLQSLFATRYPALQVIVVDNGSTDGSVDQIRTAFPRVRQLLNAENRGFAAAANQGLNAALENGCAYVMVLNNDTTVAPDLLQDLVAAGEADPQIGILSPRILHYHDPDRTWHLAARWHAWLPIPVHIWQPTAGRELVEADFVSGCGMMLRRRLLEEVGDFDTQLTMYGEDLDLCARAKRAGFRIVAVPQARMWHKVSISARKVSRQARYWRTRNQILVYRRYPHGPVPWLLPACVLAKAGLDVAKDLVGGQSDLFRPTVRAVRDGLWGPLEPVA